jgi:hypothetical protein
MTVSPTPEKSARAILDIFKSRNCYAGDPLKISYIKTQLLKNHGSAVDYAAGLTHSEDSWRSLPHGTCNHHAHTGDIEAETRPVWRKLPSLRGKSRRVKGRADFHQRFSLRNNRRSPGAARASSPRSVPCARPAGRALGSGIGRRCHATRHLAGHADPAPRQS